MHLIGVLGEPREKTVAANGTGNSIGIFAAREIPAGGFLKTGLKGR